MATSRAVSKPTDTKPHTPFSRTVVDVAPKSGGVDLTSFVPRTKSHKPPKGGRGVFDMRTHWHSCTVSASAFALRAHCKDCVSVASNRLRTFARSDSVRIGFTVPRELRHGGCKAARERDRSALARITSLPQKGTK
jgi:hypothetical protein